MINLKNRKNSVILAIFCTMLWGTAFPFIKLGYSAFCISENDIGTKLLFAGLRFSIAGIMVFIINFFIQEKKFSVIKKSTIIPVFILGFVQTFCQYIFTYIGLGYTTGANTSIITACASFFTVIFAPIFFKQDKLSFQKILGCIIGFCGIIAVNSGGGLSNETMFGDFMILMSTVSAAAGNFISKGIVKDKEPIVVTAYQLTFGGLLLLIFGYMFGGRLHFYNLISILILLWLSFVSAAAFAIWTALLKYHNASKICVFNLLVPIFGTMLSGIILKENVFGINTMISLLLISLGIFLVNAKLKTEKDKL